MRHQLSKTFSLFLCALVVSCAGPGRASRGVQILSNPHFLLPPNQDDSVPGWEVWADSSHTQNLIAEYRQVEDDYRLIVSQDGTIPGIQHSNVWIQAIENIQPGRRYKLYFEFSTIDASSSVSLLVMLGIFHNTV